MLSAFVRTSFHAAAIAACIVATNSEAAAAALVQPAAIWDTAGDLLSSTYDRAPALVLGLAVLLALPVLILIGLAVRRKAPEVSDRTQVYRRAPRSSQRETLVEADDSPQWPSDAWIEFSGGERRAVGGILRLGRDADNDVPLDDKTVHRYHAAIHRTDDAAYVITDLSSAGGNGVLINGRRAGKARLSDGDTIELGQTRLKFISRPA